MKKNPIFLDLTCTLQWYIYGAILVSVYTYRPDDEENSIDPGKIGLLPTMKRPINLSEIEIPHHQMLYWVEAIAFD